METNAISAPLAVRARTITTTQHLIFRRACLWTGFLTFAIIAFGSGSAHAAVIEAWVQRHSNVVSNAADHAVKVVRDAAGDIIVTGTTSGSAGGDMVTIKYSGADGSVLWQQRYNSPANGYDSANAVAVDGSGNVVVTGSSFNGTNSDYYTAKYAAADGALLWERRSNRPENSPDENSHNQARAHAVRKQHQHIENMKNVNHSSRPRRLTVMAGRFAAVVSIGTALLLLAGIHNSQAAEIHIVSPSAYEDIEGEGGGGGGTSPFRFQQVFPAADFAALGNKPHWLVGYSFRPDESLTSPRTVHFPDNEVRLSTTQRGPDDLSLRFDDNLGPDVMQFYRGLVILAADIDGTSPVPREFYNADFPRGVTPYLYDPSQGNLLFDAIGWQGISPSTFNDRVPGMQTAVHSSSPSATDGERIPAVMFQFTFIPVPEPGAVSLITNGGFEVPDTTSYHLIYPGQNTIAPWVVGLHSVDVGDAAGNGFISGPAFEGAQMLDLNGLRRGRLTQAFATTPGSVYTLTFAYTDNYYNSSSAASATVRLFDGLGDRLNRTITHIGAVAGDLNWTVFTGQFTALQNTTSLEFSSLTDTDGYSGGIMLDAVQVFEGPSLKILSITRAGNGAVALRVRGIPKEAHRIQASVDLSVGSFKDIATGTADAAGLLQFEDTQAGPTNSFYRVVLP